jgi:hypothetical protein
MSMPNSRPWFPQTRLGTIATVLGAVAVSLWFVLPMVTMSYREIYPITDSWVMPATSSVVTLIAAVVSGYVVVVHKERAWVNLGMTLVLSLIALVAVTVMLGGLVVEPLG